MRYQSTRGAAPYIGFREAVLSGLAPDGGLYMPRRWPEFTTEEIRAMAGKSFVDVAAEVLARFATPDIEEAALRALAEKAYAGFAIAEVAPLKPLDDQTSLLELFHGPTLAFKDVAMQMLAQLYGWALQGSGKRKTIIGATSGDTGGAAIDAFADAEGVDVFMLHPEGRISDVQRRIMTTNKAANICNIAVAGSFDDCQNIVKALFADDKMNARFDLGGVNSINWVRLAIQTVYYFTTAVKLGAPAKSASYVVPTGNFGDVFAGFAAKQMGLPVGMLGVAVNENDIMHRALTTGEYRPAGVSATSSPSMDIQVASNFERLLYEACDRNADFIQELMTVFSRDEGVSLPEVITAYMTKDFVSARADEKAVADKIRQTLEDHGELIDPHTAVGLVATDVLRAEGKLDGEVVVLATAHPAKFPDAVEKAAGKRPGLPPRFADLFEREEYMVRAPADVGEVRDLIMGHAG